MAADAVAPAEAEEWATANQRYLMARVQAVRRALERQAGKGAEGAPDTGEVERTAAALPGPSSLEVLAHTFGLSPFEQDVLLLCAGMELDSTFAERCAAAQGDPRKAYPTFGLALAALPGAHWSALGPLGPLRRWRLLEPGHGDALTTSPLRIDERVLHHLTALQAIDQRLQPLVEPLPPAGPLPASHAGLARRVAALWSVAAGRTGPSAVQLCGPDRHAKRAIVAAAAAKVGMTAHALLAADVPAAPADREALARIWEREAALSGCVLLVDCDDPDEANAHAGVQGLVDAVHAPVALSARDPVRARSRPIVQVDVPALPPDERATLWRELLAEPGGQADDEVDAVVRQFDLGSQGMRSAAAEVAAAAREGQDTRRGALWRACRAQSRPRLDGLARRVVPAARWDDLVLPDPERRTLRELAVHLRHRQTVYEAWGFASKCARGLGISALFAGPSGTGKTMAAEVLAGELGLDLYLIDLSSVVDKYVGETEKNLRRLFDAAEEGGAILLFDEADALFGKRSEVKDSHDRYANIEVSYLLQRMESYRGLAILTTNLRKALDSAFLRRLRFVVQFPFPDLAMRAEIWRRIFPAATPTEGLAPELLARLSVAGGNIRNIAMGAAFHAAEEGVPVRMSHLLSAARSEYAKLERPLSDGEVAGWA